MKKPSNQLFRLIHAMTPAEKRYFKVHFTDGSNVMALLFDGINKQKEFDEERLKEKLPPNIAKNLKVFKAQLQNTVLKSLQHSARNKQIYARIRQGLEEVDILFEKQLYDIANDRLEKVKKLCEKHEAFTYLVEISYKRFSIRHVKLDGKGIIKDPIFQDLQQHIQKLSEHFEFSILSGKLMEMARSKSYNIGTEKERDDLRSLLQSAPLVTPPDQLPFQTKISRNSILTFIYALLEDQEQEYQARKTNVELFEQFPHFKQSLPVKYIGVLRNYLNYCSANKLHEEVRRVIATAEAFAQKNKKLGVQLIHFYYANLGLWFNEGKFQLIIQELEDKICNHLSSYKIEAERIAFLNFFHLAIIQLALGNNKRTQFYIQKLRLSFNRVTPQDVNVANIIELINHYEAKDEEVVSIRISSLWRKVRKKPHQRDFYYRILNLFKRMSKHPEHTKQLVQQLLNMLSNYENDPTYLVAERHLVIDWLYALNQKSSFKRYIRMKYRHQLSNNPLS